MTQPEDACAIAPNGDHSPPQMSRLKRRADFQRAARGTRQRCEAFALQANRRAADCDGLGPRIGFTLTKKVGGAVVRNRIRRRLKEAVRLSSNLETRPDHDYVLMAQRAALARRFDLLLTDLQRAFAAIHTRSPRFVRPRRLDKDERQ